MQLIDEVWREIPDFRESYELPDGLFRQHIPVYDGCIVRELLVNALVYRPYTQRGDIYLNLRDDSYRLDALVLEDIGRYPGSSIGEIHARIGKEISRRQVRLALNRLCNKGELRIEGENRGRIYWLL